MRHVTFVHGIGNKPPPHRLLDLWRQALAGAAGLDLAAAGVTSSMVYWADVLHAEPLAGQRFGGGLQKKDFDAPEYEDAVAPMPGTLLEAGFMTMLAAKMGGAFVADSFATRDRSEETLQLELPSTRGIRRRLLEAFLRDAHHYLFDVEHQPRPGKTYRVRQEIKRRCVEGLEAVPQKARHVVVGHSLGSVIAYDCLKNVAGCPRVDALVTLGSPLGLSEVQDRLKPGYSQEEGYPSEKLAGEWYNLSDRFDPVCGLDVKLGSDFRAGGKRRVKDEIVKNDEARHAVAQYLARSKVRAALRTCLGL
jgi:hypothetical protein